MNFETSSTSQTKTTMSGDGAQKRPPTRVGIVTRTACAASLLAGLRGHDFRAARTFVKTMYPGQTLWKRLPKFIGWTVYHLFVAIPEARPCLHLPRRVSRRPYWLTDHNPLANHPWREHLSVTLPEETDTVVIGAGFTGGSLAYHWARRAPAFRSLLVLEKDDPASGASGRNEGAVVCGRYYSLVRDCLLKSLPSMRPDLDDDGRRRLAEAFADAYVRAAYRSSELIKQTIESEGFDCDYRRAGWVQAREADQQTSLEESVRASQSRGFDDWQMIDPQDVYEMTGMHVKHFAGFSRNCASWHPAKWVWCLMTAALRRPNIQLFTRTCVLRIEEAGEHYCVETDRGVVRARHVVNATEAYTAKLHPQFRKGLEVHQTQAASGDGGPYGMKPHVVISGTKAFWERHGNTVLFGSDNTLIPYRRAGQNRPSRFITMFFAAHMKQFYGPYRMTLSHEWSGSVGHTHDEYPIVGVMDGKRQYIIAGMCGSGSNVSFNAARCVVNRILDLHDEPDDYPPEFFAPTRVLDPQHHPWPEVSPVGMRTGDDAC